MLKTKDKKTIFNQMTLI